VAVVKRPLGTFHFCLRSYARHVVGWRAMQYPWPLAEADIVLDEALDIALDYLEFTRQAYPFSETQQVCADTILQSWR